MSYQIKVTDTSFEDHYMIINTLEDIKVSQDKDGLYRRTIEELTGGERGFTVWDN